MKDRRIILSDVSLRKAINMLYFHNYINRNTFCIVDKCLIEKKHHSFFHVLAYQGYRFKGITNRFIKNSYDTFNVSVSRNRAVHTQSKSSCNSIW